jgi:hypothetical protein
MTASSHDDYRLTLMLCTAGGACDKRVLVRCYRSAGLFVLLFLNCLAYYLLPPIAWFLLLSRKQILVRVVEAAQPHPV